MNLKLLHHVMFSKVLSQHNLRPKSHHERSQDFSTTFDSRIFLPCLKLELIVSLRFE